MANYVVTTYTTRGSYDTVLAALETKIETVDNTKTIRLYDLKRQGNDFVGILVYDT